MSSAPPPPARGLAPLARPLAGWGNDDILLKPDARLAFARAHPDALPVFSWPDLQALFDEHDEVAGQFRRKSRTRGMTGAAFGFLSLLTAALSPLAVGPAEPGGALSWWLGLAAILLAVAGGLIGYSGVLVGRSKWAWLTHRFWTERSRQLHFQLIVNNLPLAARVIAKERGAQATWNKLRADVLRDFRHRMTHNQDLSLKRMREDLAESEPWLDDRWIAPPPPPAPADSAALAQAFDLLKRQRFGIQKDYTERKLQPGVYSPRTRLQWLRGTIEAMTILTLALAIALGIVLVAGAMPSSGTARLLVAIGAGLTAGVMTLRMLEEGLQLRTETERYEWYLAAVKALERRYEAAPAALKVELLREMERLSYQELRRFTDSFCNARFVM